MARTFALLLLLCALVCARADPSIHLLVPTPGMHVPFTSIMYRGIVMDMQLGISACRPALPSLLSVPCCGITVR